MIERKNTFFLKSWEGEATPEVEKTARLFRSFSRDIVQLRRGDRAAARKDQGPSSKHRGRTNAQTPSSKSAPEQSESVQASPSQSHPVQPSPSESK
jgi:hypothetical protein